MVETNSRQMTIRNNNQLPKKLSIPNHTYLTTAMLLGTQNCNYLGQRLSNHLRDQIADSDLILNTKTSSANATPIQNQQMHSALNQTKLDIHDPDNNSLDKEIQKKDEIKIRNYNSASTFTIDSILATKPIDMKLEYNLKSESRSPSNSPSLSQTSSPIRPTRVPAMLHPGLHLSHLAAAATGFGTPSDFLGMNFF